MNALSNSFATASQLSTASAAQGSTIRKIPLSGVNHIYLIDWDDNGIQKEIAVVMETPDGTIYGIDVANLHAIDRKRLQRFVTSVHADKYPLWELLSQGKLNNGMNALDFFHLNYVKVKRPRGALMGGSFGSLPSSIQDGLTNARGHAGDEAMIGTGFTDPSVASVAQPGEGPRY